MLIREIEDAGGVLARKKGDHWLYRLPDGRVIQVPNGGSQNEAAPILVHKVRRALGVK
jgi:predicted RNA binding protein YcfA (HicA-like mRNA interferase family)